MIDCTAYIPANVHEYERKNETRPIHAGLAADQNTRAFLPSRSGVGRNRLDPSKVRRLKLGIRKPIPDLLNAPRGGLCVGVERDDEVKGSLTPIVVGLGGHSKVAGFAGPTLPESRQDLGTDKAGPHVGEQFGVAEQVSCDHALAMRDEHPGLSQKWPSDARPRAASRITSTGARTPIQRANAAAAWWTSIPSPSWAAAPPDRAAARNGVSMP